MEGVNWTQLYLYSTVWYQRIILDICVLVFFSIRGEKNTLKYSPALKFQCSLTQNIGAVQYQGQIFLETCDMSIRSAVSMLMSADTRSLPLSGSSAGSHPNGVLSQCLSGCISDQLSLSVRQYQNQAKIPLIIDSSNFTASN